MTRIEDYRPELERSWLECRVLAFLSTAYFDDVATSKPDTDAPVQLVAVEAGRVVVGLLDVSVEDTTATIETVAVLPAWQGSGLGTRLLDTALVRLRAQGVRSVEAWTRDDPATVRWYAGRGFTESDHYLHVYADEYAGDLDPATVEAVRGTAGVRAIRLFAHAPLDREVELRGRYRRVHVCRRFSRPVDLRPTAAVAGR